MKKFLERDDLPPATSTKLLHVLNDPEKTRKLKIEIVTTVDAMEPFVKATYKLGGAVVRLTSSSVYFLPPCLPSITQLLLLWQRLKQIEMLHMNNSSLTIQRHVYSLHTIITTYNLTMILNLFWIPLKQLAYFHLSSFMS